MTAIVALNQKKIVRCTLIIPRVHESTPPPLPLSRLDYPTITELLHAVRLYARIHAIHPPSEPRVAILCRARFVHWIQQVSLPRSTKGSRTKDSLSSAFTNELSFRKLRRVYLAVERSLDLTFDLSSIFRGASIRPGGLLFFRPSQICCYSIERIQLFLRRRKVVFIYNYLHRERYIFFISITHVI